VRFEFALAAEQLGGQVRVPRLDVQVEQVRVLGPRINRRGVDEGGVLGKSMPTPANNSCAGCRPA
jgi:hypothetical protein